MEKLNTAGFCHYPTPTSTPQSFNTLTYNLEILSKRIEVHISDQLRNLPKPLTSMYKKLNWVCDIFPFFRHVGLFGDVLKPWLSVLLGLQLQKREKQFYLNGFKRSVTIAKCARTAGYRTNHLAMYCKQRGGQWNPAIGSFEVAVSFEALNASC